MTYNTEEEREAAKKHSRKIWYEKNKVEILKRNRAYQKEYYAKYPEKQKERDRKNYVNNKQGMLIAQKKYYYKNLDKIKQYQALYRAKKRIEKNQQTIDILEALKKDVGTVEFN
jgi:hypothetical protein|tara:strand:+ start:112 stop:453 length:342 start_codon:yes stop_codon:yes gene_type:complete